jgi:hypothetical protein
MTTSPKIQIAGRLAAPTTIAVMVFRAAFLRPISVCQNNARL